MKNRWKYINQFGIISETPLMKKIDGNDGGKYLKTKLKPTQA